MSKKEQDNFNDIMGNLLNKGGQKPKRTPTKIPKNTDININKADEDKDWQPEFEEITVPEDLDTRYETERLLSEVMTINEELELEAEEEKEDIIDVNTDEVNETPETEVKVEETKKMIEGKKLETVTAIIPAGAIIKGNLEFNTDLSVSGQIEGDIKCDGTIYIRTGAVITGNIIATAVFIDGSNITGDIHANNKVEINCGSTIDGNISSNDVVLDASINGNITALDVLEIRENGRIKGDIQASLISTVRGATICGMVQVGDFKE